MAEPVTDEDVQAGIARLRELLADPAKFEKWANEMLDKAWKTKR